jgi:hypothetical protein
MNKLTDVIVGFQPEVKAGIPKIVELLTHGVRSDSVVDTIKALGQRGK